MGDLRPDPLAPHKGLSGPWRPQALSEAWRRGAEDALLLWPDGTLAESAIATVALERDGWLHPAPRPKAAWPVWQSAWTFPPGRKERGWTLHRAPIALEDCAGGQLWCLNALRGLWPATLL